jgi:hypothetical protein
MMSAIAAIFRVSDRVRASAAYHLKTNVESPVGAGFAEVIVPLPDAASPTDGLSLAPERAVIQMAISKRGKRR